MAKKSGQETKLGGKASKKQWAKVADEASTSVEIVKPKRNLSAYNYFFQHERAKLLGCDPPPRPNTTDEGESEFSSVRKKRPHRKTHGKIGFTDLAKRIGQTWRQLDPSARSFYEELAAKDLERYKRDHAAYKQLLQKAKERSNEVKRIHEEYVFDSKKPAVDTKTPRSASLEEVSSGFDPKVPPSSNPWVAPEELKLCWGVQDSKKGNRMSERCKMNAGDNPQSSFESATRMEFVCSFTNGANRRLSNLTTRGPEAVSSDGRNGFLIPVISRDSTEACDSPTCSDRSCQNGSRRREPSLSPDTTVRDEVHHENKKLPSREKFPSSDFRPVPERSSCDRSLNQCTPSEAIIRPKNDPGDNDIGETAKSFISMITSIREHAVSR